MASDPVDDAARLLRMAFSVAAIKEQAAITVLCKEIERLRALIGGTANKSET